MSRLLLAAALALAFGPAVAADPYLSLQAGVSRTDQSVGHPQYDYNPHGLGYDTLTMAGVGRIALGWRHGRWALEAGYSPSLGRYDRAIDCNGQGSCESSHQYDTVGEVLTFRGVDVRAYAFTSEWRRLSGYGFVSVTQLQYTRNAWVHNQGWNGFWTKSTGKLYVPGGGVGVALRVTPDISLTAEVARVHKVATSAMLGVKVSF
jgi:hypothetical protein